jgi:hypothetical protein
MKRAGQTFGITHEQMQKSLESAYGRKGVATTVNGFRST